VTRRVPGVFAVEDHAIQITWPDAGGEPVQVRATVDGRPVAAAEGIVDGDGGAGALVIGDLPSDRDVLIRMTWRGTTDTISTRTLTPPAGELLARFATVSDIHLGERSFGLLGAIVEDPAPIVPVSIRAAHAAIDELQRWGAELLVIKGDLTAAGQPAEWRALASLLEEVTVPTMICPGNHETARHRGALDAHDTLIDIGHPEAAALVQCHDLPGLRVVLADTTLPPTNRGRVAHVADQVTALAADGGLPTFVALHHQLLVLPVPTYWPPGVPRGEANRFVRQLQDARPASLITSGHTHRNRRRQIGSVVVTEVGSPKDYPGVWAGYAVHEGGIRQVVRRVSSRGLLSWTDATAGAAGGTWGLWSPGRLSDRCFSHTWPA
jgi:hypothetical protein